MRDLIHVVGHRPNMHEKIVFIQAHLTRAEHPELRVDPVTMAVHERLGHGPTGTTRVVEVYDELVAEGVIG
ncbi:MAG: hypothetical protein ACYDAG_04965 [Chloroflexota bacterium]